MASAETFRLGQVLDPLPGHEAMAGRICIPYIKRGRAVCLKFRCVEGHNCKELKCPKYLADGHQWLYNTDAFVAAGPEIAIVEGEFDAMIMEICGIPAVGIPGVEAWRSHPWWPLLFKGFSRVWVVADNDAEKERNYGHEMARQILKDVSKARLVHLPPATDPTEAYLCEGREGIRKRMGLAA